MCYVTLNQDPFRVHGRPAPYQHVVQGIGLGRPILLEPYVHVSLKEVFRDMIFYVEYKFIFTSELFADFGFQFIT